MNEVLAGGVEWFIRSTKFSLGAMGGWEGSGMVLGGGVVLSLNKV